MTSWGVRGGYPQPGPITNKFGGNTICPEVFVYRIEIDDRKLVVATDTEGYTGDDKRLIQFACGADLLIHDAEYTAEEYLDGNSIRQGRGHSSWEMAVKVAQAAGAKKLILTCHNVHHDDAFLRLL